MTRAIDPFVNPNFGAEADNPLVTGVKEFYFKNTENFFDDCTIDGLLKTMDEIGVEHSVLTFYREDPKEWILEFSRKHPDRFSVCAQVDIDSGMENLWAFEDLAKSEHVTLARVAPMESEKPPTHARYYPVFAKCVEMDMPLSIFAGIPGPRADAAATGIVPTSATPHSGTTATSNARPGSPSRGDAGRSPTIENAPSAIRSPTWSGWTLRAAGGSSRATARAASCTWRWLVRTPPSAASWAQRATAGAGSWQRLGASSSPDRPGSGRIGSESEPPRFATETNASRGALCAANSRSLVRMHSGPSPKTPRKRGNFLGCS